MVIWENQDGGESIYTIEKLKKVFHPPKKQPCYFYERNDLNFSLRGFCSRYCCVDIITGLQKSEIFHLQSEGSDSVFCCSVEEVEDLEEKLKEEQEERGEGEDYQESAKHIKVIETDFKRPLRSSFRAKKGGEKR